MAYSFYDVVDMLLASQRQVVSKKNLIEKIWYTCSQKVIPVNSFSKSEEPNVLNKLPRQKV